MHVHDTHGRHIARPAADVFRDLENLGTDDDRVWPAPSMPFWRTPGPLRVGVTVERHGIIRAALCEYVPGRRMMWRADQPFLQGIHGFELTVTDGGCYAEHVLEAETAWWFAPIWRVKVSAVHDRIVEGLLDRLARTPEATSAIPRRQMSAA